MPAASAPIIDRLRQLALRRIGAGAAPRLEEDGRVLNLFRNRAELKKAYADLQTEIHQLKDRVKQQEGATVRVQEMLERLEDRLSEPAAGHQVLVFYQLRDLWKAGSEQIRSLVAELAAQREDMERRQHLADFNRRQFEQRQGVEQALNSAQVVAADMRARVAELQNLRARANRWWHYFKRRDLDRRLLVMRTESQAANQLLGEARHNFEAVANLQAPDFPGLSVAARREINLAAIAAAELLAQRLARTPLLQMAGEAMRRRESPDSYGDAAACAALMTQIGRAKRALGRPGSMNAEACQHAEALLARAKYRAAGDVVPTDESLLADSDAGASGAAPPALREDYWDLRRSLLS